MFDYNTHYINKQSNLRFDVIKYNNCKLLGNHLSICEWIVDCDRHQVTQTSTTIISPLESMGGPLFYRTSTTNIVMISPSIFMSALLCLTRGHHDTCWTHCTS